MISLWTIQVIHGQKLIRVCFRIFSIKGNFIWNTLFHFSKETWKLSTFWPEKYAKICKKNAKIQNKNQNFAIKSLNIRISPVLCLYKRKMVIPTCSVSFSIIVCKYFSKWRINVFLKLKRLQQPPSPSDFDDLSYPRVRWYPQFFFHEKMTAKDVEEITYMPLVTFFSVLERPVCWNNRKGVRRGLTENTETRLFWARP